jgi:hypothetical protein
LLAKHTLWMSVKCCSSIIEIVRRSSPEVGKALRASFDVEGASLEDKPAQSGSPMDWSLVKVYGVFLQDECLFLPVFHPVRLY